MKLNSNVARFLRLFQKALSDIASFIIIELIIISLMATVMQVLGARFDDGGNMDVEEGGYDTDHNDYPLLWSYGVSFLSVFRTAAGDLQMPTYDYWAAQYED